MLILACEQCGTVFKAYPSHKRRYCSPACYKASFGSGEARFRSRLSSADPVTSCILWKGCRNSEGYGQLNIGGKPVKAHRYAWELQHGRKVPDGLFVCHTCDSPLCVNHEHLFIGTGKDNTQDAARKGRMPWGERNGRSKLSDTQALEICGLLDGRRLAQCEIARMFHVDASIISEIKTGRIRQRVTGRGA